MRLRPYQREAQARVAEGWCEAQSQLVVMATGLGKTVLFASLAGRESGRVLILAHRDELVRQAAAKVLEVTGEPAAVEMGQDRSDEDCMPSYRQKVVVSSVQTMSRESRQRRFDPSEFSLVVTDECFPAGTLVDGRPIESYRPGDEVTAFDPDTRRLRRRRVVRTFESRAPRFMVRVTTATGAVLATPGHPFLTSRGWVNACEVGVGDEVYRLRGDVHAARAVEDEVEGRSAGLVLPPVPRGVGVEAGAGDLCAVLGGVRGYGQGASLAGEEGPQGLLLDRLHQGGGLGALLAGAGGNEPEVRLGQDEGQEPDAEGRGQAQGLRDDEADGAQASLSGRQRTRPDRAGARPVGGDGASALRLHGGAGPEQRLPVPLQAGPGGPRGEAGRGGGRRQPQEPEGQDGRRPQGGTLEVERVVRVEVLERPGDGGRRGLCPGDRVYNLEVEGDHTYVAEGFAVHNCHHSPASSYKAVYDHFSGVKHLGVTATPHRNDKLALGQVFERVAYEYGVEPAVADGWLVPVRQHAVKVEGLDFSQVRTLGGDFNEADLEAVIAEEKVLHATAVPTVDVAGDRPCLVFCVTVNHARLMADVLNRYKPGSAVALSGDTDMEERRSAVEAYKRGDIQFMVNCGLFLEGFDAPTTAVVVMARPTKSLALYAQVLGRGTRPLPGVVDRHAEGSAEARRSAIASSAKSHMTVLDFVGNSGRHKIVTAGDLLGGKYGEPVRKYARRTAEDEGLPADVAESLERAKDELALLAEIEERRKRDRVKARAEYAMREVSPFGAPAGRGEVAEEYHEAATHKQVWFLVKRLGFRREAAMRLSKRQASAVIGKARG